jgi:hypothetical protein
MIWKYVNGAPSRVFVLSQLFLCITPIPSHNANASQSTGQKGRRAIRRTKQVDREQTYGIQVPSGFERDSWYFHRQAL